MTNLRHKITLFKNMHLRFTLLKIHPIIIQLKIHLIIIQLKIHLIIIQLKNTHQKLCKIIV